MDSGAELGPELGDVYVDGPVACGLAAGGGEQLAPGQDAAGVVRQRGEHRGLGGGQVGSRGSGVGPPGERTRCGAVGLAGVGQDVADQGDELAGAERAGQPAPGAGRVAAHGQAAGAGGPGVGDQEDDRRAQGPADAPGVQAGHGEIDHGRGVRSAGQLGQRRLGAGDQPDPEPVLAQVAGRHLGHLGLVLGQQDRDRLAFRRVARHRPGLPPLCRPSGPGRGSATPTWSRCPRRAAAGADQDGQTGPT